MTNDLSHGSIKRRPFRNLADMMDTQPSYAPKFCLSQAITVAERIAMLRAARAFNFHAEQAGQARRAFIF